MKPMLWPILGLVRFYLALVVAASHVQQFDPSSAFGHHVSRLSGLAAVLGFLVISGFSIAASFAQSPVGFYRRRLLRIMPLYVLAIVASALCTGLNGGSVTTVSGVNFVTPPWNDLGQSLFLLQGFTGVHLGTNPVLWTLSVEVVFYLLTPLLARLSQLGLSLIAAASLTLFLLSPLFSPPFYSIMRYGSAAALLAWVWLAGFIVYRQPDHRRGALVVLVVCLVALSVNSAFLTVLWPVTIITMALAVGFGGRLQGPGSLASFFSLLGDASYPLYLFHLPLFVCLTGLGLKLNGVALLGLAIGFAAVLDRLYDQRVKQFVRFAVPRLRRLSLFSRRNASG